MKRIVLFLIACPSITAMEVIQNNSVLFQPHPLIRWKPMVYSFPSEAPGHSWNQEEFQADCEFALSITKKQAKQEKLSKDRKQLVDWLYTLQKTQAKLLTKPFCSWTIDDVLRIASWLNRLTDNTADGLRQTHVFKFLKELPPLEKQVIINLLHLEMYNRYSSTRQKELLQEEPQRWGPPARENRPLTSTERILLDEAVCFWLKPSNLKEKLEHALVKAQEALEQLTCDQPHSVNQQKAFKIGVEFLYDCIEVRPLQWSNKNLARICMFCLHMQWGIDILPVDREFHGLETNIIRALQKGSPQHFYEYYTKVYKKTDAKLIKIRQLNDKELSKDEIVKQVYGCDDKTLEYVKAHNLYEKVQNSAMKPPDAVARICAQCSTIDHAVLKLCARCRNAYYCSEECQRKQWSVHKLSCKKAQ